MILHIVDYYAVRKKEILYILMVTILKLYYEMRKAIIKKRINMHTYIHARIFFHMYLTSLEAYIRNICCPWGGELGNKGRRVSERLSTIIYIETF